jgi:hypothetical protein
MPTVQELTQPSEIMRVILPQMLQLRAAYEGGMAFKQTVLIKKQSESAPLFKDKIDNVAGQPVCKSIVEEMVDIIFESEPIREIKYKGSNGEPVWMKSFLENADLERNTLTDVMEKAATLASIEGWSWIVVDLPDLPVANNRPYLCVASAEQVIDWEYDQEGYGAKLECLRVIEYQDAEKMIVTQWDAGHVEVDEVTGLTINEPTTAKRYIIELRSNSQGATTNVEPDEIYTFPSNYPIPFIQLVPVPDLRNRFIGNSDIVEAADVQRELLRLEAEAFDSIRFAKPLIRASAGMQIPAGGGGIARGEKDSVEVFEIPTADIAEIRNQQNSIITFLDSYLGRGSVRKQTAETQSGVSIIEERKGLHRKAATRARVLASTEEEIFTLVGWMMGLVWEGLVEYNTDYEARDTQYRLSLLQTAKNLSANTVVQQIIDNEVIKLIAPAEELTQLLKKVAQTETNDINRNTTGMPLGDSEDMPATQTLQ